MTQQDCLDWLLTQHKKNPYRWFRVKDVQQGLLKGGKGNGTIKNVPSHLLKLTQNNDIQMRGVGLWKHYKEFKVNK